MNPSLPAPGDFAVRPLVTYEEMREGVRLQEEVWGEGFSERVPASMLMVAERFGGVAAGAFAPSGEMAGFVFGLTGIQGGEPVHWSDMLAVRKAFRGRGLGLRLKAWQRSRLLEEGVQTVLWSFDPLRSLNAHLNFRRLGVLAREYRRDLYGESDSPLHREIGTDRLIALWELKSPRVRRRVEGRSLARVQEEFEGVPAALGWTPGPSGEPAPGDPDIERGEEFVTVSIPARLEDLLEAAPAVARAWREATRTVFQAYLDRGYEVREFLRGEPASRYLLVRPGPSGGET